MLWLLTIWVTFAQSDFENTYTTLVEWVFSESIDNVSTGTMVESWVLNLSVKGQFSEMEWWINLSMQVPYTTYINNVKKHQSYSKVSINGNIEWSLWDIIIPNTAISVEMDTITLSHYMYYKIKRLDFDVSKWNNSNEDLQYIKELLKSDGKQVYMNRWIRVRTPKDSVTWWYNTPNIQAIREFLIKNPIFKQIWVTNKGYIITFDEKNLQKFLPIEFADRLNEIQQRAEEIDKQVQIMNSWIVIDDSSMVMTGIMTTGTIPAVEFFFTQDNNTIEMNMNQEGMSLNSIMNTNDEKFNIKFNINSIWDQTYTLWFWIKYAHNSNKDHLDFLMESTSSYLFFARDMKIRTPINAKTMDKIMQEI